MSRRLQIACLVIAACSSSDEEPCPAGTFSAGDACTPWQACSAGEFVAEQPGPDNNRTCAPCGAGTFSDTENAESCAMWTACAEGFVEETPATATSDRVCRDANKVHLGTADDDLAHAVGVDGAGNVFVAGWTGGSLPGHTSPGSANDAFVRKYDSTLREVWTRQFTAVGNSNTLSTALAVDAQGNSIVAGQVYGAFPGQTTAGGVDVFVRKYDSAGTELWTKQFGSDYDDHAGAVAFDALGNVYVAGEVGNVLPSQTSAGAQDAFVRKYDSAGNEVWTRQFGSSGSDVASSIQVDANGDIIMAGSTSGTLPGQTSAGSIDAFVTKYDASGTAVWTRQFGSVGNGVKVERGNAVSVDAQRNVYVAGSTGATLPDQTSAGSTDLFVRKYSDAGVEVWTRQLGTAAADVALSTTVDAAGRVFVAGQTGISGCGQAQDAAADAFVRELDGAGTAMRSWDIATSEDDRACAVSANAGAVVVAGGTMGALAGHTSNGGFDAFVMKLP